MSWTEEQDEQNAKQTDVTEQAESLDDKKNTNDRDIWQLLEKTLHENVVEKRRARRWKIFFRFTTLAVLLCVIGVWVLESKKQAQSAEENVVAMIPMRGVIGAGSEIESSEYVSLLDDAYQNAHLEGVVIEMNSPGGSPVHAGIIYDAIRAKEQAYPDIPVIVVVEDMAASGGYYIAAAANEIYADKASLVGSIGVISSGFEASHLLEKIGVQRRTFTAGRNKAFLDPFTPMTKEAKDKWQAVLDETHQQFINSVKQGRGERLTITDDVFSGMVFTGSQALKIGLIDGLSSVNQLLNTRFANATPVYYEPKEEPWKELAKEFGVEMATKVLNSLNIQ